MDAPNVDQFYTSGCVGFSGTNMLNCTAAQRSRRRWNYWENGGSGRSSKYLDNNDGLTNYGGATTYDPFDWIYPPTDEGSSAIGLMKFWLKYGIIDRYEWAFTFDQFLAALQRQPVLVGTNWYKGMFNPSPYGVLSLTGNSVGGHEYLANAILWDKQLIGFENSWGENWGLRGRFYMPFDMAEELIINQQGDVAVPSFL